MELHNMKYTPGSRKNKSRIGRGDKTAGRGENGQKSRAGYSKKIGFEGGQNPLYRRIPKRGFTNSIFKTEYTIVGLGELEKLAKKLSIKEINPEILIENGLIKLNYNMIKILSNGQIKTPINISAHKFSNSAKLAIEKAGGTTTQL